MVPNFVENITRINTKKLLARYGLIMRLGSAFFAYKPTKKNETKRLHQTDGEGCHFASAGDVAQRLQ